MLEGLVSSYKIKILSSQSALILSITESGFEALWVEVLNDAQCNLLCGVIYRHPGGNIDRFMEYLNSSIDKIHGENKLCVLMGDFNLDLLMFESHKDTDSFLNPMLSTFFQPQNPSTN